MKKLFLPIWLSIAFSVTVLAALIHLSVQQDLRQGANDPQIQMAEDAAAKLEKGEALPVPSDIVDLGASLAPFMITYDNQGLVTSSSSKLNGQTPSLPPGVLDNSKKTESRLTWQPAPGVRIAAVIKHYSQGYVLAGRSLREVENREDYLMQIVVAAWIVALGGSFVLLWVLL